MSDYDLRQERRKTETLETIADELTEIRKMLQQFLSMLTTPRSGWERTPPPKDFVHGFVESVNPYFNYRGDHG